MQCIAWLLTNSMQQLISQSCEDENLHFTLTDTFLLVHLWVAIWCSIHLQVLWLAERQTAEQTFSFLCSSGIIPEGTSQIPHRQLQISKPIIISQPCHRHPTLQLHPQPHSVARESTLTPSSTRLTTWPPSQIAGTLTRPLSAHMVTPCPLLRPPTTPPRSSAPLTKTTRRTMRPSRGTSHTPTRATILHV